ncbi:hypothetical protein AURDEDRAFT_114746 [Auricularia subglabra TFB-10046 SS5]|nr:hypothetical protein AURDEDRAFT_114746 [Auricularia subglabra TFB-10046 SS5]
MASQNAADALPPRVKDAIRERFDEIYSLFADDRSGSDNAVSLDQDACLSDAAAFRRSIMDYVESLHSDLRFRLSARARINQLPDDVLVSVMSTMPLQELVVATHVCHRWRKLGIETPALWTQLTLTDALAGASEVLLERSKAAILDLEISISPNALRRISDPARLVGPSMERVRSLTIQSDKRPPTPRDRRHFNDFGAGFPVPMPMPAPRGYFEEGPQTPLLPAPRLETLRLDSIHGVSIDNRISFDCSMVREAYVICGVFTLGFLRVCSLLRVLVLHVPPGYSRAEVLRIVRANPELRTLELHVPLHWGNPGRFWGVADGADAEDAAESSAADLALTCELERLVLHPASGGVVAGSLYDVILVLISRFDCSRIREVEVSCHFHETGDALGDPLLAHLQEVTSIVLGLDSLRLEDTRGYVRRFLRMAPSRPLQLALPFLGLVRSLDARLSQWSALPTHRIVELPVLEELTLRGSSREFATMQPGAACPALRELTVVQSCHEQIIQESEGEPDFFTVAMNVPRERLHRCPTLQQLTIVHETDGTPLKDLTLHFNPPAPGTVFVTSAFPDMPTLATWGPPMMAPGLLPLGGWNVASFPAPPVTPQWGPTATLWPGSSP